VDRADAERVLRKELTETTKALVDDLILKLKLTDEARDSIHAALNRTGMREPLPN
jgi:hypothetical protein